MALDFGNGLGPNLIVDNGGDATLFIHKGVESENKPEFLKGDFSKEGEDYRELIEMLRAMHTAVHQTIGKKWLQA